VNYIGFILVCFKPDLKSLWWIVGFKWSNPQLTRLAICTGSDPLLLTSPTDITCWDHLTQFNCSSILPKAILTSFQARIELFPKQQIREDQYYASTTFIFKFEF